MGLVTEEYQTMVLDDLAAIEGLYHPVKTTLLRRLFVRRTNIKKLHPNPEDEFCNPSIGPSYDIISNYEEVIRYNLDMDLPPIPERIVVEKISTGGYMILNGHHRWFACHRMGIKRV
ncbi:MAG: ParB N-terminal domain-containing protein, partial [Pseudobutyrivibrio sp.]|nr:ParB N-terminal domain-containing protein [Pseudobutyrivibrio sp.]